MVSFTTSDGERWRVDVDFLGSGWTCTWGDGCRGIGPEADPTHVFGCCSLGAELAGDADAMNVAAHAAFVDPERFQYAEVAERLGVFADEPTAAGHRATRVVDGACIFLNRPGFAGGAGCALHHQALADDEPPRDWKPTVCWQLPFRIDTVRDDTVLDDAVLDDGAADGTPVTVVRAWARADFDDPGDDTPPIPWLCTEDPDSYRADTPAVTRHRDDLVELLGEEAVQAIEQRVNASGSGAAPTPGADGTAIQP